MSNMTGKVAHKSDSLLNEPLMPITSATVSYTVPGGLLGKHTWSGYYAKLIADAWESPKYTDFEIRCQDRSWNVHRFIICARSKYFEKACELNFRESHEKLITIKEEDPDVVETILKYMYTGVISIPSSCEEWWDRSLRRHGERTLAIRHAATGSTDDSEREGGVHAENEDQSPSESKDPAENNVYYLGYAEYLQGDSREWDKDDSSDYEPRSEDPWLSDPPTYDTRNASRCYVDDTSDITEGEEADRLVATEGGDSYYVPFDCDEETNSDDGKPEMPIDEDFDCIDTTRLIWLVRLFAAADKFDVPDMTEPIHDLFQAAFHPEYTFTFPAHALRVARVVYLSTSPTEVRLRWHVKQMLGTEAFLQMALSLLPDRIHELFEDVPQLAVHLLEHKTFPNVAPSEYRSSGGLRS